MKFKAILSAGLLIGSTFLIGCTGCGTTKTEPACCDGTETVTETTVTETDTVSVKSL